jgi:hypothetical protein
MFYTLPSKIKTGATGYGDRNVKKTFKIVRLRELKFSFAKILRKYIFAFCEKKTRKINKITKIFAKTLAKRNVLSEN